jgi:uncharacterized protein (TIGR00251 family)
VIALTSDARGTVLPVKAQPGARREGVLGERAGALRVAVSAAPERGKANAAIVAVLADALRVKRSEIALLSGETSRDKRFLVEGLAPDDVMARLDALLGSAATPEP